MAISSENVNALANGVGSALLDEFITASAGTLGFLKVIGASTPINAAVEIPIDIIKHDPATNNGVDLTIAIGGTVFTLGAGAAAGYAFSATGVTAAIAAAIPLAIATPPAALAITTASIGLTIAAVTIYGVNEVGNTITEYFNDFLDNPKVTTTISGVNNYQLIYPDGLPITGTQLEKESHEISQLLFREIITSPLGKNVIFTYVDGETPTSNYTIYDGTSYNLIEANYYNRSREISEFENLDAVLLSEVGDNDEIYISVNTTTNGNEQYFISRDAGDGLTVPSISGANRLFHPSKIYRGNETQSQAEDGFIIGGNGNEILGTVTGPYNHILLGLGGNDSLTASGGNDEIYGDDKYGLTTGNDTLKGSYGNDVLVGGNGLDELYGEQDNDILKGGSGNDTLDGGSGNDFIEGGIGADSMEGGTGSDTLSYINSTTAIEIVIQSYNSATNAFGGVGITGEATGDLFYDFEKVVGSEKFDNKIHVQAGLTGVKIDYEGFDSEDAIYIDGPEFANAPILKFAGGYDSLIFTGTTVSGASFVDVTGLDRIYFESDHAHELEIFDDVVAASDNLALEIDFRGAVSSANSSTLDATAVTSGAIGVFGGAGSDSIETGGGDDTLLGGAGADTLDGGDGLDWLLYEDGAVGVDITLTVTSQDTVNGGYTGEILESIGGSTSIDEFSNIEGIQTSEFNDTLNIIAAIPTGQILSLDLGEGENTINLTSGADTLDAVNFTLAGTNIKIYGHEGNDSFGGFAGFEHLFGGAGSDTLIGGSSADSLDGGENDGAADILKGGTGYDRYYFETYGGIDIVDDSDGSGMLWVETGVGQRILHGSADTGSAAGSYTLDYNGSEIAELVWTGDPNVIGSTGSLTIDYDPSFGNSEVDISIVGFSNGDFGIHLEGAEEGNGGGGPIDYLFSTPSADDPNWNLIQTSFGDITEKTYVPLEYGDWYDSTPSGFRLFEIDGQGGSSLLGIAPDFTNGGNPISYGQRSGQGGLPPNPPGGFDGASVGEPHIVTYDGLLYDFQDAGEFTLVESTDSLNPFTVQARQKIWDGGVNGNDFSVNTAVATEIGTTKVGIYIPGELYYNDTIFGLDENPLTAETPALYIEDHAYILPDNGVLFVEDGMVYREDNTYTIINNYGDGLTATVYDEYMDINTFLSNARNAGSVQGLLGDDDGDTSNEFALEDGTILGESISSDVLYDTFGEDWRITQGESLFLYGTGETTSSFDNPNFDNSYTTLADFTTTEVNTATTAAIAAGFDQNSDIFDAIVMDFIVMGDVEYTDFMEGLEALTLTDAVITDPLTTNDIMGTSGNDYIIGTVDADHIIALAGNDTVYGRADADTIIGGGGDDSLYGEGGGDTYLHYRGDGSDYLLSVNADVATVKMNGVSANDLYLDVDGYHLIATDIVTGESVQMTNQYYLTNYGYKYGTLNGVDITSSLHVRGSSDTAGEVIYGTLHHGDTLEGGLGDDTLYANGGTDFFVHNVGDGNDELHANNNSLSTIDMVAVATDDIRLRVDGYDLEVINEINGETITLYRQLYQTNYGYKFESVNGINLKDGLELDGDDTSENIDGTVGFADTITGGLGDDTIDGNGGADHFILNAGDGSDVLINNNNSLSTITINGIANADLRFNVSGYHLVISNVVNSDVITLQNQFYQTNYGYKFSSVNGIDLTTGLTVEGSSSGDTLYGTANADSILGGDGADVIYGGLGDDTLIGGLDNDTVYGEGGTDVFIHDAGDGSDQLFENPNALAIITMNGVANDDIFFTVDGNDLFATNTINGEQLTINDQYYATNYGYKFGTLNGMDITGGLTIKGTSTTLGEHIKGTTGADTLIGGAGDDTIEGRDGADIFIHESGDGSDTLYSWNGAQATITMNGVAAGDLRVTVSSNNLIITDDGTGETLTLINQLYQTNFGYKFASVNGINLMSGLDIEGSSAAEVLYGTTGIDTLTGNLGDDTIYGQGAADSFVHESGDGSDTLYANNNNLATVTMNGVNNSDLLFSANGNNLVVTDTVSGESLTLVNQYYGINYGYKFSTVNGINVAQNLNMGGTANADDIHGSAYDDSISGGLGNDTIDGEAGVDTLHGDAGNDTLYGGNGGDSLYGDAGDDSLNGEGGNDTLYGGDGDDTLTGSSNYDYFVFTGANSGDDTITDFYAFYDQLQFDSSIFATAADAVAAFSSGVIDLGGGNSVTLTGITTLLEADVEIV